MHPFNAAGDATPATSEDLRELMEEPAGGYNYGRAAVNGLTEEGDREGRKLDLSVEGAQERDLLAQGGWSIVHAKHGGDAGVSAHRGVLHPDEYVDTDALRAEVERAFGFTTEQVRSVYRQGRLSLAQTALRARIDARLLDVARAGGEVHLLGRAFGLGMSPGGNGGEFCPAIRNALVRARAEATS